MAKKKICPQFLAKGTCDLDNCELKHNLRICRECNVVCPNDSHYEAHIKGRRHRNQVQGISVISYCSVCQINITSKLSWSQHVSGKRHATHARQSGVSPDVEPIEAGIDIQAHEFCTVCKMYIHERSWKSHPNSRVHRARIRYNAIEAAMEEAAKDKHGVTVSNHQGGIDFGVLSPESAAISSSQHLCIQSTVPLSDITLIGIKLSSAMSKRTSPFSVALEGSSMKLIFGRELRVMVSFTHRYLGVYQDRVEMTFEDNKLRQKFLIARSLKAIVGDQATYDALQPIAPFVPRKRTSRNPETEIIPGDPPPALKVIPYVVKLPENPIPQNIAYTLSHGSQENIIKQFQKTVLPHNLEGSTYGRHFKVLLWAEEHRSEQDLQIYDIPNALLKRHNTYYYLDVPGLAEKRPSVLVGDRIFVQPASSDTDKGKWFEGCVHIVHKAEVGMRFHRSFVHSEGSRYRVRFKLNRYPLRRQHQAMDTAFSPERILFPTRNTIGGLTAAPTRSVQQTIYNRLIASNPAQLQAVASICQMPPGSPPFGLFGPPGTGKTVTVVESIRQILARNPRAHILACAPSNSAADLIAQRLTMLSPEELFRFYAPSRFKSQAPDSLASYTISNANGHFTVPPMATLKRYRVIVSTCVSASFAYGVGMPRGHFTHMFFDEAGQATEPETMIAIKTMADNETNIVLSGDHRQLGPIIRSPVARDLGLEKSFLERLMDRECYDEVAGRGITVVKLVQNFRSHQSILSFPNDRFYKGELQPYGDPAVINSYIGSPLLQNKKFPIIFHALSGKDDREASSPSFFNVLEALQVKSYIEQLRSNRAVAISDKDIAVITPYHAQVLRIRSALRGMADGVKVGSVEELQGQERLVIIISTVRSSQDFVEYDLRHTLGFVANPRRLNVAITRAKALLIIVGDPSVLSLDPLWRAFLNYIHNNRGWRGDAPTWDTSAPVRESGGYDEEVREVGIADMNEFTRRMEELTKMNVTGEEVEEDGMNVDRPWRDVE